MNLWKCGECSTLKLQSERPVECEACGTGVETESVTNIEGDVVDAVVGPYSRVNSAFVSGLGGGSA